MFDKKFKEIKKKYEMTMLRQTHHLMIKDIGSRDMDVKHTL